MAAGSAIEKAEINDEVSTRVLSYIAPVLHKATQVRGFVSVHLDRAEIPLWGGGERQPNVDGTITFHDVVYGPGTLAKQLLTLTGKGENLGLRLDQAVKIQVADGRVTQSGLAIDMGNDVKVDLAGSVGFDQSLKMKAAVPVTGAMLGNQAALQEIVGGTRVGIPIGGTMTHPAIDRQALRVGLKDQSREIIKRSASRGVGQVLDRVTGTRGAAGRRPVRRRIRPLNCSIAFTGTRGAGAGPGRKGLPPRPSLATCVGWKTRPCVASCPPAATLAPGEPRAGSRSAPSAVILDPGWPLICIIVGRMSARVGSKQSHRRLQGGGPMTKTHLAFGSALLGAVAFAWAGVGRAQQGVGEKVGEGLDEAGKAIKRGLQRSGEAVRESFARTKTSVQNMGIEARVFGRLHWDKDLNGSPIELEVRDASVAILKGSDPPQNPDARNWPGCK